jgi:FAD:protein FMN transferase
MGRAFSILLLAAALLFGCARTPPELVLSGPTMGTTYTVKVAVNVAGKAAGSPRDIDADAVRRAIDEVLASIDHDMSTYRADSAISRFNAAPSTEWIEVPVGLAQVVALAQTVSERSAGAFDITVAPLIQAWGFGASGEPQTLPTEAQIAALQDRVGYRLLDVRLRPPALRKLHPALTIDVNGLAPGHAVDVLAERLKALGIQNFMIDIGGEVLARGRNASGSLWRIAIERPEDTQPAPFAIIELDNRSVATSGEYRHYFERDGKRYSHTIDPRSGHPIASRGSVAVVGATSLEVDAWATALNVLGPDAGHEIAEREGIAAMYLLVDDGRIQSRKSSRFERSVPLEPN